MKKSVARCCLNRRGQGTVEYALIVIAVVAVVVAVVMSASNPFKTAMQGSFNKMSNNIKNAS